MSAPLHTRDVLHFQRLAASAGLYTGSLDGVWGPKTDEAQRTWESIYRAIRSQAGEWDTRSESYILTLLPAAQRLCRRSVDAIRDNGIDARVLSGTRTYAEQTELYMRGRYGRPGPKVTNAKAGQSNHNFGIAWDIGIFDGGRYLRESLMYAEAGRVVKEAMSEEVEWGGDWKTFKDRPHYQVRTGLELSEVRRRFESGKLVL